MEFTLITLTGPAGAGKDTVADILQSHLGFSRLAFADALRAEICAAFSLEPVYLSARSTKEQPMPALALRRCRDNAFIARVASLHGVTGMRDDFLTAPRSPRQILQWWGTEYRREQDPDYWINQVDLHLGAGQFDLVRRIVVTDTRFDNEAAMLRAHGGIVWAITRPGHEVAPGAHVSETDGERFAPDVTIANTGTIDDLRELVLSHYAAHAWSLPGVTVQVPRVAQMSAGLQGQGGAAC